MMEPDPPNPYAAPETRECAVEPSPGLLPAGPYGPYRDNQRLCGWLVGLLAVGILFHASRAVVNLLYTLSEGTIDEELSVKIEQIFGLTGLTGLACMILFGVWIVRSGKNAWLFSNLARQSGTSRPGFAPPFLQNTPGWAVGWYFIPIANFWKPYGAMKEIVQASSVRESLAASLLPTWWTLWLASLIFDRVIRVVDRSETEWDAIHLAVIWTTASGIEIALHLIAIVLVSGVTRLQASAAGIFALPEPDASASGPPGPA
jgi:hypothetical protein